MAAQLDLSFLSLSIKDGEKILIIYPPSSFKDQFMSTLFGPVNTEKKVIINNKDILSLPVEERLEWVGRAKEDPDKALLFHSIEEELDFPLRNLGKKKEEREEIKKKTYSSFSLENLKDASSAEISGGEKRRLLLALLFAINPALYILDEPFESLSSFWKERVRRKIRECKNMMVCFQAMPKDEDKKVFDRIINLNKERNKNISFLVAEKDKSGERFWCKDIVITRERRSDGSVFSLKIPFLSFQRGDFFMIRGENGSGKTTLSFFLSGLLKEKKGKVNLKESERRALFGFVMQESGKALFLPTVYDELKSTGKNKEEIERVLCLFSLKGESYVTRLSYGEKKILQAAIFYLLDKPFVIFDEVESALSLNRAVEIINEFTKKGTAVLIITHSLELLSVPKMKTLTVKEGEVFEN